MIDENQDKSNESIKTIHHRSITGLFKFLNFRIKETWINPRNKGLDNLILYLSYIVYKYVCSASLFLKLYIKNDR